MMTKLKYIFQNRWYLPISITFYFFSTSFCFGQDCIEDLSFNPSTTNKNINWDVVPDFSLPFTNIYGGPSFYNSPQIIFRKGFTHLGNNQSLEFVKPSQQAIIYYGPAFPNKNQPWEILKTPYGNDMNLYQNKWRDDLLYLKSISGTTQNSILEPDIFCFDIERQQKNNDSIAILANHPSTPLSLRNLPRVDFILQFKKDLQALYNKPYEYFIANGLSPKSKISSYSDAPVWNTFANIQGNSWDVWKTDKSLINYLTFDFDKNTVGGKFFDSQNFLSPSAYYYFDYPSPLAGDYLSYMLFQIEINKVLSNKPIIPFLWLRYSFNKEVKDKFIRPWMAEASAIFPYFSGASGIWLWDDPFTFSNNENFNTYEYYLKGQYRLSKFKTFFEGDYELVVDTPARVYNENRLPIWRAVQKNNQLLVAAHNPYPKSETEEVNVLIKYKNITKTIKLTGYEVYLCSFDLNLLANEPNSQSVDINVFPNPASNYIQISGDNLPLGLLQVTIYDLTGKVLLQKDIENQTISFETKLELQGVVSNNVIVQLRGDGFSHSKRVILKNDK